MKPEKVSAKVKGIIGICLVAVLIATPLFAAEKYPSKPVNFICQWAAGGSIDVVMRIISPVLESILGKPFIVVNKPGASGYIGFKTVTSAKPDGYTLGFIGTSLLLMQNTGEHKISMDEFTCIAQVYSSDILIVVNADSPWKTIEAFVDYARKNPGKLKHGNTGYAGPNHVDSEAFAKAAGLKFTPISYKGYGPALVAVAMKEVDFTTCAVAAARPLLAAGKVRILATMSDKRSPQTPDVPTLKEKGINCNMTTFNGIAGPAGMPKETVDILEKAAEKALKDPGLNEAYQKLEIIPSYRDKNDFKAYMELQDKYYKEVLKGIGIIK